MQNLLNELQKIGFVDTNDVDSNKNEFYDVALINENMKAVVIYTNVSSNDILYQSSLLARQHQR